MESYAVIAFAAVISSTMAVSCFDQRRAAQTRVDNGTTGVQVPDCDRNGDWKPLQCHPDAGVCSCVNPVGENIKDPSFDIKTCVCFVQRDRVIMQGSIEARIPACEESGYFKKIQCHESRCSCANYLTGESQGETLPIDQFKHVMCP